MKIVYKTLILSVCILFTTTLFAQQKNNVEIKKVNNEECAPDVNQNHSANWYNFTRDENLATSIQNTKRTREVSVYPNPSNGHFNVDVPKGAKKISICSSSGSTIFEMDVKGWEKVIPVDLSDYDPGIYFVFLSLEGIQAFTRLCVTK
jgi:hypothetical protein